jgi:hypothetical protein
VALRQVDDRRLVEPFAGVGTSVEQLLDDPAEETIAVGEPQTDTRPPGLTRGHGLDLRCRRYPVR